MIQEPQMMEAIQRILPREGGFVNDPLDPGGATNFGITQKTLSEWFSSIHGGPMEATVADVENLSVSDASKIYLEKYIKTVNLHYIPDQRLFELVVDCGVNHGVNRAIRWLQTALGVDADGKIGRETKLALESAGERPEYVDKLFNLILAARIRFYVNIAVARPTQIKFLRGWMNRALGFLEA